MALNNNISSSQVDSQKGTMKVGSGYVVGAGCVIDSRFIYDTITARNAETSLAIGLTCYVVKATSDGEGGYTYPGAYYVMVTTPEINGGETDINECWKQIAFGTSTSDAETCWEDSESLLDA